jgi:predicted RNA binding protein YcfA (HicA-like mRNA interferase family)
MGKRKFPPLKHSEVVAIMLALGFTPKHQVGSHVMYERLADPRLSRKVVPVDDYDEFEEKLLRRLIHETGFTRKEFYEATRRTAKKIR